VQLLVAGGTSFVGRAIALAALDEGHEVTVINRGVTPSDLPESVTHLVGERLGDLSALDGRSFDATVDTIAYRPSEVAALHAALGDRGGHHLQISSVSAYLDPPSAGATEETATLWPAGSVDFDAEITGRTYGPLKAACERAASELFGADTTFVRPTYVIGGHDATLRFPYWVQRARRGGRIAVPGPRTVPLQYIDARDLGAFVVTLLGSSTTGAFTAAGPWPSAQFVDSVEHVVRHVAPAGTTVVEVDPAAVERLKLGSKFQLWTGPEVETAMTMDPSAALAAGLSLQSIESSVDDVLAWWGDREWPAHWMTAAEEEELLSGAP